MLTHHPHHRLTLWAFTGHAQALFWLLFNPLPELLDFNDYKETLRTLTHKEGNMTVRRQDLEYHNGMSEHPLLHHITSREQYALPDFMGFVGA
jgi:hypothetical protein